MDQAAWGTGNLTYEGRSHVGRHGPVEGALTLKT